MSRVLSPKGPGTVAWAFFEAQFDVVRGVSLPATCPPWLCTTEDTRHMFVGDEGASSDSASRSAVPFCMHPDVEELGTAGTSLNQIRDVLDQLHALRRNVCWCNRPIVAGGQGLGP